ncbi:hypothetical protein HOM50_03275 [bacterium]|nr:hypothetical protein [bacterium]MBT5015398.1 hypothetical protein [bacterium]
MKKLIILSFILLSTLQLQAMSARVEMKTAARGLELYELRRRQHTGQNKQNPSWFELWSRKRTKEKQD